jgi:predicted Zn finger-like uncharacterized protein
MIVTCPACRTRYLLDDKTLAGSAGRTVRCAHCGNTWHQRPEPALPQAADLEPAPVEPPLDMPPRPAPAREAAPAPRRQRGRTRVFWPLSIVVILALIAAALIGRRQVVAHFPHTAPAYAFLGLPVTRPAIGRLAIRKIQPTRSGDGLVIEGEVANIGEAPRTVPRLRVALCNASDEEVQAKIIVPPKGRLKPGEVEHFRTVFERPNQTATEVAVSQVAVTGVRASERCSSVQTRPQPGSS